MTLKINPEAYVFISQKTGKYIGLDLNSGGYPYETKNLDQAKLWQKEAPAWEWHKHFKNEQWALCPVYVNILPVN